MDRMVHGTKLILPIKVAHNDPLIGSLIQHPINIPILGKLIPAYHLTLHIIINQRARYSLQYLDLVNDP